MYHLLSLMYSELYKKIPFVVDGFGKSIEFYMHKLSKLERRRLNNSQPASAYNQRCPPAAKWQRADAGTGKHS